MIFLRISQVYTRVGGLFGWNYPFQVSFIRDRHHLTLAHHQTMALLQRLKRPFHDGELANSAAPQHLRHHLNRLEFIVCP
jgi:hypothetical protein